MKKQRLLFCIIFSLSNFATAQAQGITISGTVYDDGTESSALGKPTNMVGNKPLYANLSYIQSQYYSTGYPNSSFYVQASVPVSADGTYSFTNVTDNSDQTTIPRYLLYYQVSLSIEPGIVNSTRPSSMLPNAIKEGAHDYHFQRDFGLDQDITIGNTDLTNVNFSFNQFPTVTSVVAPDQPNPDDANTLSTVPALAGSDPEDGIYNSSSRTHTIALTSLPRSGTLFYDNIEIRIQDFQYNIYGPLYSYYPITNFDPTKLKVRSIIGTNTISFTYNIADAAGRWSPSDATMTIPFSSAISYDYGDIYDPYNTHYTSHRIVSGLHMGQVIDSEPLPFSSARADGDDLNNLDDEDGIVSFAPLSATNTAYSVTVSVLNNTGQNATLSGWIDFNVNGIFDNAERAQFTVPSGPTNTDIVLTWTNLTPIVRGSDFFLNARFRLASNASEVETPNSSANSGEVEDYVIPIKGPRISGTIFADGNGMTDNTVNGTPWQNQFPLKINIVSADKNGAWVYETFAANVAADGTFSFDSPNTNTTLNLVVRGVNSYGGYIDAERTGAHIGTGPGNDLIFINDNDGRLPVVISNSPITDVNFGLDQYPTANNITSASQTNPLGTNQIKVPPLTGTDPEDGTYDGSNGTTTVAIYFNYLNLPYHPVHSWGTLYYNGIPVTDGQIISNYEPAKLTVDPNDGNLTVEFYFKVVDRAGAISAYIGKVTMPITDTVSQIDFGDAPDTYRTSTGISYSLNAFTNGPRHTIVADLQLGMLVDAEADGSVSNLADGDNLKELNDEDGVTSFPIISGGASPQLISNYTVSVNVTNNTSVNSYLSGWIDWNTDGSFGPNEIAQATIPASTNGPITLTWTNQTLTGVQSTTATYARFRLSTDATSVTTPIGSAPDGEVEDYNIPFVAALPVDLVSFQGSWVEGRGNQLSWTTAWERDNDHFEIQSSSDAKSFENIGRLTGKANITVAQTYSFVDSQPRANITYYRLKQVDKDGTFSYSRTIAVQIGIDHTQDLLIYPNPTTDLLQIQVGTQQTLDRVRIYGALGRLVFQQEQSDLFLNVKSLPVGVYVLEVTTSTGQVKRQRFIKQ